MKSRLTIASVALVFLIGIGVLLYPKASDLISQWTSSASINSYIEQVARLGDAGCEEELVEARAYNAALAAGEVGSYELSSGLDGQPVPEAVATVNPWVQRVAMLKDAAMIGYIRIPKVDVYLPVYHGTSTKALENGVGHLDNTSLPVGGTNTHSVLSGHTGLPTAELLTNLDQLEIGDEFFVYVLGETLKYKVDQIKTVLPTETDDLSIVPDEDLVTLVTCTPYGINSHRLLVRARRTAYVETEELASAASRSVWSEAVIVPSYAFAGFLSIVFMLGVLFKKLKRLS